MFTKDELYEFRRWEKHPDFFGPSIVSLEGCREAVAQCKASGNVEGAKFFQNRLDAAEEFMRQREQLQKELRAEHRHEIRFDWEYGPCEEKMA